MKIEKLFIIGCIQLFLAQTIYAFEVPGTFEACEVLRVSGKLVKQKRTISIKNATFDKKKIAMFKATNQDNEIVFEEGYKDFHKVSPDSTELNQLKLGFANYASLYDIETAFAAYKPISGDDDNPRDGIVIGLDSSGDFAIFINSGLGHYVQTSSDGTCINF